MRSQPELSVDVGPPSFERRERGGGAGPDRTGPDGTGWSGPDGVRPPGSQSRTAPVLIGESERLPVQIGKPIQNGSSPRRGGEAFLRRGVRDCCDQPLRVCIKGVWAQGSRFGTLCFSHTSAFEIFEFAKSAVVSRLTIVSRLPSVSAFPCEISHSRPQFRG